MRITDQVFNDLIAVSEMMAVEIESFIEDAERSGCPQPDLYCVIDEWRKVQNTLYLTIAAQQVVVENTPPLHQLMGIEVSGGINLIVPITQPTTHKGQTYYQQKETV